jgi:TPR repeat protein
MARRFGEEELKQENLTEPLENRLRALRENIENDPANVVLPFYAGLTAERLAQIYRETGDASRADSLEAEMLRLYREAAARGHEGAAKKLIDKGISLR